jgi:hypothetical protein
MIVLACGGRDYNDKDTLYRILDELHAEDPISHVIQGECSGADVLAKAWADERGISCSGYAADWSAHGRAAGPIRNRRMLEHLVMLAKMEPTLVVAFPGGRGTGNMIQLAKDSGVTTVRVVDDE